MDFYVEFESGVPIYVQLKDQIKYAVATGRYPPGSRLPTVRQLAVELRINANTVSKVYSELEHEGILATRQGKGTFVREVEVSEDEAREQRLDALLESVIVEAYALGYQPNELLVKLKTKLLNGEQPRGGGNLT
ncbi:hypothetical protein SY88_19440 [Clostridiales bacterium PH28_bin88]|nr:hypothetical protein SY88_19440 [Clostridiales bacterium PH28_bin88]